MSAPTTQSGNNSQATWSAAFLRVLRPLVRVMLARGLHYPAVAEMLKTLFVEIADREFRLDSKRQTDSRISLLTGVHRKDVRRLRHGTMASGSETAPATSLGAQIIAAWSAAPFVTEEGEPLPLARFAQERGDKSFESLVRNISTDIHPRAVLDEWLRLGIARLNERNEVCLISEAFIPQEGEEEKRFYFTHDLHDHAAASAHNVLGNTPPFLERCVHYEGLDAEAVAQIRQLATKNGMRALRAVNARAAEALSQGRERATTHPVRMTFGVYFYEESQSSSDNSGNKEATS